MGGAADTCDLTAILENLAGSFDYSLERHDSRVQFLSDDARILPAFEIIDAKEVFVYFEVRTTSWDFDGERTDLHDALSLFSSVTLRTHDVSCALWDIPNMFSGIRTELYGRYITVDQPTGSVYRLDDRGLQQLRQLLAGVRLFEMYAHKFFEWNTNIDSNSGGCYSLDDRTTTKWASRVARATGEKISSRQVQYNRRKNPHWFYYRSVAKQLSVFRSAVLARQIRQFLLAAAENVLRIPTVTGQAHVSALSRNFVSHEWMQRAEKVLNTIEPRRRDPAIIFPIDSHFLAIGREHVVTLRHACGKRAFDEERERVRSRRRAEDKAFFSRPHSIGLRK